MLTLADSAAPGSSHTVNILLPCLAITEYAMHHVSTCARDYMLNGEASVTAEVAIALVNSQKMVDDCTPTWPIRVDCLPDVHPAAVMYGCATADVNASVSMLRDSILHRLKSSLDQSSDLSRRINIPSQAAYIDTLRIQ